MKFWNDPTYKHACILSWFSIIVTLTAAIGGLIAGSKLHSSLMVTYGLENCVDFLSSVIVVWRFYSKSHPSETEEEYISRLNAREKRSSVAISFVLFILGFGTIIAACQDFSRGREEGLGVENDKNLWTIYFIALASVIVFGSLALIKFRYAKLLHSSSLKKDGICSLIGAILAVSMFFNAILILNSRGIYWWLDPLVALFCGIGAFFYALYGIHKAYVKESLPIFKPKWWLYGGFSTSNSNLSPEQSQVEMTSNTPTVAIIPNDSVVSGSNSFTTSTKFDQGDDIDEIALT
jgi:divalent metal cation (Fe/Co/Zn/Cd) transporter